jgi:hypothetical protein
VFYNVTSGPEQDVGEEDFRCICDVLERERSLRSRSSEESYDIILVHVQETNVYPTLVVTTSDPRPKEENTVLSMLFTHNNPAMRGSVEPVSPAELTRLLRGCLDSRSVNVEGWR